MIATLTRIFGFEQIDLIEDAVQEAFVQALRVWPYSGAPRNPSAWLTQVAKNRALDSLRRSATWRDKERAIRQALTGLDEDGAPPGRDGLPGELADDQLAMVFACCHPLLSRDAQVALTLKTVGGFGVAELARAFVTQRSAMAQRLLRAKQRLRDSGIRLEIPVGESLPPRLDAALEVLYLMFNEGYSPLEGELTVRPELCHEAIRLAELVCAHPATDRPRSRALAALLSFQASRLALRARASELILLQQQDRSQWDRACIARGLRHLERAGRGERLSAYHLEAEIAACHAVAKTWGRTDWARIVSCYDSLLRLNPSPIVAVNRAVALAELEGPAVGLATLAELSRHPELRSYYPFHAARAELHRRLGQTAEATAAYRQVLALTGSGPVRRFCERRIQGVAAD